MSPLAGRARPASNAFLLMDIAVVRMIWFVLLILLQIQHVPHVIVIRVRIMIKPKANAFIVHKRALLIMGISHVYPSFAVRACIVIQPNLLVLNVPVIREVYMTLPKVVALLAHHALLLMLPEKNVCPMQKLFVRLFRIRIVIPLNHQVKNVPVIQAPSGMGPDVLKGAFAGQDHALKEMFADQIRAGMPMGVVNVIPVPVI